MANFFYLFTLCFGAFRSTLTENIDIYQKYRYIDIWDAKYHIGLSIFFSKFQNIDKIIDYRTPLPSRIQVWQNITSPTNVSAARTPTLLRTLK